MMWLVAVVDRGFIEFAPELYKGQDEATFEWARWIAVLSGSDDGRVAYLSPGHARVSGRDVVVVPAHVGVNELPIGTPPWLVVAREVTTGSLELRITSEMNAVEAAEKAVSSSAGTVERKPWLVVAVPQGGRYSTVTAQLCKIVSLTRETS
jgi:hypothetical protein